VVPAVGVLLGWLVLGERLGASGIAGLTLIAGSMALVTHGEQLGAMVRHVRRRLDVTMPVLAR
jgi:drug/metabolite transporter (DMT)-like permease